MSGAEDPRRGWTPWAYKADAEASIGQVWWDAVILHFPKENVTHWYDGSELVGEWKWGCHRERWRMKQPPADWMPWPGRGAALEAGIAAFRQQKAAERAARAEEARRSA